MGGTCGVAREGEGPQGISFYFVSSRNPAHGSHLPFPGRRYFQRWKYKLHFLQAKLGPQIIFNPTTSTPAYPLINNTSCITMQVFTLVIILL